eukprot:jgi/Astpho2/4674/Aster-00236
MVDQQVLRLYRHILQAAKRFPTIKRDGLVADIKASYVEFHQNKTLTDPDAIQKARKLAVSSLGQLQSYVGMDHRRSEWEVSLKGACLE